MLELNLPILPVPSQWDFTEGALAFCLYFLLPERSWCKGKGIFESKHKATAVREENFYTAEDAQVLVYFPRRILNRLGFRNENSCPRVCWSSSNGRISGPITQMWFRKGVSFYSSDSALDLAFKMVENFEEMRFFSLKILIGADREEPAAPGWWAVPDRADQPLPEVPVVGQRVYHPEEVWWSN